MSLSLRYADQRWILLCDRSGCLAHIVGPEGDAEAQRKSLVTSADMLGWRLMTDIETDLCDVHAHDAAPVIPRDQLCPRTWCILRAGHDGPHSEPAKREMPKSDDFGPEASKRRRW